MGEAKEGGNRMIYLDEHWAKALNDYLCYKCFGRLVLDTDGPVCPRHGKVAWVRRSRRNLFASIRASMRRNNGKDEVRRTCDEAETQARV